MMVWIDAQISPAMAAWIQGGFSVNAKALELLTTGESLVEITAPQ